MAEIRSTLDLVMERTRNLTMSEDDRREQALAGFRGGVNGLIRKYLLGEMDERGFQEELGGIERDFPEFGVKEAASEIVARIDPARDNARLLKLLRFGCEKDVTRIEGLLKEYDEKDNRITADASGEILARLMEFGISGSAVVPNTSSSKDLATMREELIRDFRKHLEEENDRL